MNISERRPELSINFGDVVGIMEEIKKVQVYWREGLAYHQVKNEEADETPGGSEAKRFKAVCGDEQVSWTVGATSPLHWESLVDAINSNIPPCRECFKDFAVKLPKQLEKTDLA